MKNFLIALFLLQTVFTSYGQKTTKTENVILITLDGMRWQEIFTGAERRLITNKEFVSDSARISKKFWNDDAATRREQLLPFFWTTIRSHGQFYGNRSLGNKVNVTNNQWFSYPGYNEILTGYADNERIHSNDKLDNPNKTVLEFINSQKGFNGRVAAFSSWDVFPYIINVKRSGVMVSAGLEKGKTAQTSDERLLNELMFEVPNPLGDVRLDAFTFRLGWEHLKKNKPRVLYLAFDETDDFAHGGRYDLYLESANHIDGFIQKLWTWIQSTEGYKDKTTLMITADHGRGNAEIDAWRNHGANVVGADQIWLAVMGPDSPAMGEVNSSGQLYQNQIAATIASLLGLNYTNEKPVGAVIGSAIGK